MVSAETTPQKRIDSPDSSVAKLIRPWLRETGEINWG